jgi:hypothetical protein
MGPSRAAGAASGHSHYLDLLSQTAVSGTHPPAQRFGILVPA